VYTLSDDRLMDAILQCHREGITVRILSDNDKMFDQGSDIQTLHRAGLTVKVDNSPAHMHHKFIIVDRSIVLTGSYNWTRSAATKNAENLVVIEDQETARQFTEEFERLWQQASYL
jgi:phosphatidylserine/phosphatidylglycerophosphate/cardiolipin synthase-like enzyme